MTANGLSAAGDVDDARAIEVDASESNRWPLASSMHIRVMARHSPLTQQRQMREAPVQQSANGQSRLFEHSKGHDNLFLPLPNAGLAGL